MAKSFFFKVEPEQILTDLRDNYEIEDVQETDLAYRALGRKLQISKIDPKFPCIPNIVLVEEITPQGEIVPDERAREVFAALKKKFGRPRKEVEEYYFPGKDLV